LRVQIGHRLLLLRPPRIHFPVRGHGADPSCMLAHLKSWLASRSALGTDSCPLAGIPSAWRLRLHTVHVRGTDWRARLLRCVLPPGAWTGVSCHAKSHTKHVRPAVSILQCTDVSGCRRRALHSLGVLDALCLPALVRGCSMLCKCPAALASASAYGLSRAMHVTALPFGLRVICASTASTGERPRRFLYNMGQAKSRAYIINGLAMLASFFIFRNVLGVGAPPCRGGMAVHV